MTLLRVRDLVKHYQAGGLFRAGAPPVRAVEGVSFDVDKGETLGRFDPKRLEAVKQVYLKNNVIARDVPTDELYTNQFVN